jgi:hypothetical protein
LRFDAGAKLENPKITAAFVVDGTPKIGDESLGAQDFFYVSKAGEQGAVTFPAATTLLAVTMR